MPINSCSSCASSNLATHYAEQLSDTARDRLRGGDVKDAKQAGQVDASTQIGGATVNSLGEAVGALIITSA